jgi:type I restriction enzyme, R subunit
LFTDANEQVFYKVIVITDRTVLDKQLQRTIYQFDHTPGVVMRIDEDSAQLAAALEDSTSKIIISTLQKFPYVLDKIAGVELGGKRYAVIVDEAHSSQGGDAAARLRQAIGAGNEARLDETPLE